MSFGWRNSDLPNLGWLHKDVVWLDKPVKVRKKPLTSLKETSLKEVTLEIVFDSIEAVWSILADDFTIWSNGEIFIVQWHVIDNSESPETELDVESDRLEILGNLFGEERAGVLQQYVLDMTLAERSVQAQIARNF